MDAIPPLRWQGVFDWYVHLLAAGEKTTMQQLAEVVNGGSAALSPAG